MNEILKTITVEQLEALIGVFNESSDSFSYALDLDADSLFVSDAALKIFDFPSNKFSNAKEILSHFVYRDDFNMFATSLNDIFSGKRTAINVRFRALNRTSYPVWLNIKGSVIFCTKEARKFLVGVTNLVECPEENDPLTNLPTETNFRKNFEEQWNRAQKTSGFLLKIDIDNMGSLNEQYGMLAGDFVVTLIADCVKRAARGIADVYKLNGDEFLCANLSHYSALDAQKIYQNLKMGIAATEQKIDYEVVFTVSAGAVTFFNDPSPLDELLKKVNHTVKEAKHKGRNNLTMFNAGEYSKHLRDLNFQEKFRNSIKNNFEGFQLFYQPVVDAKNMYLDSANSVTNVIGAEALLRFSCPEFGMITPDEFIPVLENSGLIIPVGRWILMTGFKQCKEWNKVQKDFHLSINLSYVQVKKSDILSDVQMALDASGVKPQNITLELTESGYMDSAAELQNLVESFRALGLNIDIDDFGTGYSNLRYLQYLNANTLKLDYSFVHKATGGDKGDKTVIKHITHMAHELNMKVCMEGVESEEDLEKLNGFEPDKFQGYFFGRPCNPVVFREHHLREDSKKDSYSL
ncbi:putative bifunctional diguanylate cyclase/phosphodiesterase [Treponema pectinovorum]|uniref:putative bifunctional diguanylate cyclase/phosphodiesterase n=1 Tax=Treponema pectinovorum TaxID=164 RepID=UPI0011C98193|nr:bifunctional diguanylate cyclase/phosphodiesterase [Treponema pectinovorum]